MEREDLTDDLPDKPAPPPVDVDGLDDLEGEEVPEGDYLDPDAAREDDTVDDGENDGEADREADARAGEATDDG